MIIAQRSRLRTPTVMAHGLRFPWWTRGSNHTRWPYSSIQTRWFNIHICHWSGSLLCRIFTINRCSHWLKTQLATQSRYIRLVVLEQRLHRRTTKRAYSGANEDMGRVSLGWAISRIQKPSQGMATRCFWDIHTIRARPSDFITYNYKYALPTSKMKTCGGLSFAITGFARMHQCRNYTQSYRTIWLSIFIKSRIKTANTSMRLDLLTRGKICIYKRQTSSISVFVM